MSGMIYWGYNAEKREAKHIVWKSGEKVSFLKGVKRTLHPKLLESYSISRSHFVRISKAIYLQRDFSN